MLFGSRLSRSESAVSDYNGVGRGVCPQPSFSFSRLILVHSTSVSGYSGWDFGQKRAPSPDVYEPTASVAFQQKELET